MYSMTSDHTQLSTEKWRALKGAFAIVQEYPCQKRLRAVVLHLSFGLEYLWSICGFREQHCKAKALDGHRLHLYFSGNFRLKLLRVEFASKQIALKD